MTEKFELAWEPCPKCNQQKPPEQELCADCLAAKKGEEISLGTTISEPREFDPFGFVEAEPGPVQAEGKPAKPHSFIWRRGMAYLVDQILTLGITLVFSLFLVLSLTSFPQPELAQGDPRVVLITFFVLINFLVRLLYFTIGHSYHGTTAGKKMFRIKVVDRKTGRPLGIIRTLWRWVVSSLSLVIFPVYIIKKGAIPIHDRLARSQVILDR